MRTATFKVSSVQAAIGGKSPRNRTSSSEHAEYYVDDGRVIIEGGKPELVDLIKKEKTTGTQLTWFANDNNLIVFGAPDDPAQSTIRKSNKK